MSAFLGLKQLESDFYQASFDLKIAEGDANPIAQMLRRHGRSPQDVRHLLLTHAHPDHIGNAAELQRLSGATLWMNAQGAGILEAEHPVILPVNIRGGGVRDNKPVIRPATVGHKLMEGQRIDLAGGIAVIDTPGHSADHQSFLWHRHGGVMIVGDAVTNENGVMDFAPFYDDSAEELRSVEKLKGYVFEKMAFGHGEYIPRGAREQFLKCWSEQAASGQRG